ncbi:MAG TPA: hypothetical protein PJ982_08120, partial [Lacipirellulaceae bacterium]|nr:hypothetical protein [Lacipirellulaceae bacterium]
PGGASAAPGAAAPMAEPMTAASILAPRPDNPFQFSAAPAAPVRYEPQADRPAVEVAAHAVAR